MTLSPYHPITLSPLAQVHPRNDSVEPSGDDLLIGLVGEGNVALTSESGTEDPAFVVTNLSQAIVGKPCRPTKQRQKFVRGVKVGEPIDHRANLRLILDREFF